MLKVHCVYQDTNEDKLMLETDDWAEAVQFIKIIVSLHGYDWKKINVIDNISNMCIVYTDYADNEYCYIIEGTYGIS